MRWIILIIVTIACCFGFYAVVHWRLSRGGTVADMAKPLTPPKAAVPALSDMSALESIDTREAKTDYAKYLEQVVPSLDDSDARAHDAALDIITSLPGQALPAVEQFVMRPDLKDSTKAALTQVIPLLQSRAGRQAVEDRENASLRDAALAAYDQFGQHNPRWDAAAHDLIKAYFRLGSPRSSTLKDQAQVSDNFEKLIFSAHCDDALLAYFYSRTANEFHAEEYARQNSEQSIKDAVAKMDKSHYPDAWKALAHWEPRPLTRGVWMWRPRGYFFPISPGFYGQVPPEQTQALLKAPWLAPRQKIGWLSAWLENLSSTALNAPTPKGVYDIKQDYDRIKPIIDASMQAGGNALLFEAKFDLVYAGMKLPNNRSPSLAESVAYNNVLMDAERSASIANVLDKDDDRASTLILEIRSRKGDTSDNIDRLYTLAMKNNPDNYRACLDRLFAYEDDGQMMAFARQCRATHNYRGRLPLMMVEAAQLLCAHSNSKVNFISHADVWQDIHDVYEQYLVLFPEDRQERTRYVTLAAVGEHWRDAKKQFDVLDTNPWPGFFDVLFQYDRIRETANHLAKSSNN